jgi:DNA-binding MarR family transcriptional regulator
VAESGALLPAALRNRGSFALIRLAALVRQDCAEQLAPFGIGQAQHGILCCLDEFGPCFQKDVAARLGLDSGDLVAHLDGLQDAGLISRERDTRDRRRQVLTITESGRRVLRQAETELDESSHGVLTVLSPAERAELRRLATRVLLTRTPAAWATGPAEPD